MEDRKKGLKVLFDKETIVDIIEYKDLICNVSCNNGYAFHNSIPTCVRERIVYNKPLSLCVSGKFILDYNLLSMNRTWISFG